MNVLLVEFNSHHDECLYSQVAFLKDLPGVKLFLVANYRLKDRISYLDEFEEILFIRSKQWGVGYLRILNFIRGHNVDRVIFNSLANKSVKRLMRISSKSNRLYYGTLHNVKHLNSNKFSTVFKSLSGIFFLNDYLLDALPSSANFNGNYSAFYPIFFDEQPKIQLVKPANEVWITIPGKMELGRRDYTYLIQALQHKQLESRIKLIFLGRSNPEIRQAIEVHNNDNFIFWDDYVTNDIFKAYLAHSDYILPLIDHDLLSSYSTKISGSFNLAFSYKLPMIMNSYFKKFSDFERTAIFYNQDDDLIQVLNSLAITTNVYENKKWTFDYQRNRYLELLAIG